MPVNGATAIGRGGAGEKEYSNMGGRTAAAASSWPTAARLTDSLSSAAAPLNSCLVLRDMRLMVCSTSTRSAALSFGKAGKHLDKVQAKQTRCKPWSLSGTQSSERFAKKRRRSLLFFFFFFFHKDQPHVIRRIGLYDGQLLGQAFSIIAPT
jgi:hypothetical protein